MSDDQIELPFAPKDNMNLEMLLHAKFITIVSPQTPEEQASLDALNHHAEAICETLQPVFQALVIEMLALKRESFATGG